MTNYDPLLSVKESGNGKGPSVPIKVIPKYGERLLSKSCGGLGKFCYFDLQEKETLYNS